MSEGKWVAVCSTEDIELEDVMRFDHEKRTFAIYRSRQGKFYATDGFCTHERAHLADGFVIDNIIECPMHNGRFNYITGEAMGAPVFINLQTYPIKIEGGKVFIKTE